MTNLNKRGRSVAFGGAGGLIGLASVLAMAAALASVKTPALAADRPARPANDEARGDAAELPFKDVKFLIEHNATAQDTGFQVFLDGDPWNRLAIASPDGKALLEVRARGRLKALGLTELFFETNEPTNADVPIEELLANFPEGTYDFEGQSIDGAEMAGRAILSHAIPKGPRILSPSEGAVVDPSATVVKWEPVTESLTGSPVEIVSYEVIITKPVVVMPPGFSKPVLSVHVSGTTTSLTIPKEFFEPATAYEFEVLALEVGGNQTISSGTFSTR